MKARSFAFVLVLGLASSARADAIPEPPESCPIGSTAMAVGHGGWVCAPLSCDRDEDCTEGRLCVEVLHCERTTPCGDAGLCTNGDVVGTCGDDGVCPTGSACEAPRNVCAQASAGGGGSDCGCRAPGAARTSSLALASILAVLSAIAVRRGRR